MAAETKVRIRVLILGRLCLCVLLVAILAASTSVFRQLSVLTSSGGPAIMVHHSFQPPYHPQFSFGRNTKSLTNNVHDLEMTSERGDGESLVEHQSKHQAFSNSSSNKELQLSDIKPPLSRVSASYLDPHDIETLFWYRELTPAQKHAQLREFYTNISTSESDNLWDDPNNHLPEWMKLYFSWHQHVRKFIRTEKEGKTQRYLVMLCSTRDGNCGGLSDRLKPLPLMIRAAYYSKRILLIQWATPRPLTDFLLPPRGGLDWRTPSWMSERRISSLGICTESDIGAVVVSNKPIARTKYHNYQGGSYVYDRDLVEGEKCFQDVFHDIWRIAFTPTAPIRELIELEMDKLGLVHGQYTGAHLRALYKARNRPEDIQRNWAENALNCASELRPGKKRLFFASDSALAANLAVSYGDTRNVTVVTRNAAKNPIHIDTKSIDPANPPNASDFFEVFVDLYILAQADCVTYSKGGYGRLALFMNRNSRCGTRQDALGNSVVKKSCRWVDDPMKGTTLTHLHRAGSFVPSSERVYLPEPM